MKITIVSFRVNVIPFKCWKREIYNIEKLRILVRRDFCWCNNLCYMLHIVHIICTFVSCNLHCKYLNICCIIIHRYFIFIVIYYTCKYGNCPKISYRWRWKMQRVTLTAVFDEEIEADIAPYDESVRIVVEETKLGLKRGNT